MGLVHFAMQAVCGIDNGRQLMCDRILWSSDGWPYITNGTPASVSRAPVFKNEEEKE